jgi:hypothetical protein
MRKFRHIDVTAPKEFITESWSDAVHHSIRRSQISGRLIVKGTFSAVALALALAVAMSGATLNVSTANAQAKTKVTVTPASPEARMKMCGDKTKGMYRTQHDGVVFAYGNCLNKVAVSGW